MFKNLTQKVKSLFGDVTSGLQAFLLAGLILAVIVFFVLLTPFLTIWAINTISELAGQDLYIEHGIVSYIAVIIILSVLRSIFQKG